MRPPDAAALRYRAFLRRLVKSWQGQLWAALEPTLAAALPSVSNGQRGDADDGKQTPEQVLKRYRLRTRERAEAQKGAVHRTATDVTKQNASEFKRVIGIPLGGGQPGIAPLIDTFMTDNLNLITSVQDLELEQIGEVIESAVSQGLRVEELRDLILERFEVSQSRADLIARDQVLKLNGQITKVRQVSAGIVEYIWTTSGDERVRGNPLLKRKGGADHFHLNGVTCRWDAPPVTNPDTGETNNPGEDYQCRCVAFPVIPDYSEDSDGGETGDAAAAE